MRTSTKIFQWVILTAFVFSSYVYSQERELEKGPITLASITAEIWGSYKIRPMLFPSEEWEFYVIVVPTDVRQGDLVEMAKDFYSRYPKTRV